MRKKTLLGAISAISLLIPQVAFAQVPDVFREYVTFGNFNVTLNAFERLALLMSDNSFNTFALISIIVAALVWGGSSLFHIFRGGTVLNWYRSIVIVFIGALVYIVFIIPKSDLMVYDEPSNRHKVVAEVPDGLILLAGIQNQIVQAAIDMIWTSSDPESYRQNARGDIYNILENAFKNTSFMPSLDDSTGKNLGLSLQRYFKDCVLFELQRPGSELDTNDFYANTSIIDILEASQHPSQSTVWFDQENLAGIALTCTESYQNINAALNRMAESSGTNLKFWQERCEKAGYYEFEGVGGVSPAEICRNKAVDFLALFLTPESSVSLMRQYLVSNEIYNYIKLNHVDKLADFKIATSLRGEASSTATWLPLIKGAMFAVYLGLTPFVFLLLPSLLFPRVIQFVVGIFVFMTAWEICDAILHSYAMDMSIASFREILNNGLSLKSLWMMEGEARRSLLIFGKMRWASMLLAGTLSFVLARFGGVALAHFAGQMTLGHRGVGAAGETIDPSGRAHALNQLPHNMPTEAITNEHGLHGLTGLTQYRMMRQISTDSGEISSQGGAREAAQEAGKIAENEFISRKARSDAINDNFGDNKEGALRDMALHEMQDRQATVEAMKDTAEANGQNVRENRYDQHRSGMTRATGAANIDRNDWALAGDTAAQQSLAEKGAYLKNKALDDIRTDGGISPQTQSQINALGAVPGGNMAFLNAPAAASNLNDVEKQNLANWMNANGYAVSAGALGSQVGVNFALDGNGNLMPSGINSFEGHQGHGGFIFTNSSGNRVDQSITKNNPFTAYQADGSQVTFTGGHLSGDIGGVMNITNGVTSLGTRMDATIGPGGVIAQEIHPSTLGITAGQMLNHFQSRTFAGSSVGIVGNQGDAVQTFKSAIGTYASQTGISQETFQKGVEAYGDAHVKAGIPFVGAGAQVGVRGSAGKSFQNTHQSTEDILATGLKQRLTGVENNAEARQIMQEEYDKVINSIENAPGPGPAASDNSSSGLPGSINEKIVNKMKGNL